MGFFDAAKATILGQRAYKAHVSANKLLDDGKTKEAQAKYEEAARLYEEADRMGLEVFSIQMGRVVLLLRYGEFEKARETMLQLSRRKNLSDGDWFSLRIQYAICEWKQGQLDKAIETIRRAAAHNENGTVFATLGMFLVDKAKLTGEFDEALEYNRRAMDYDDEDAAVLDNMGQLYETMAAAAEGEQAAEYRAQAKDYYTKAHAQRPRQITTIYYLARMLHEDGDDAGARKLLSVRDSLYISAVCPVPREAMDALAKAVG